MHNCPSKFSGGLEKPNKFISAKKPKILNYYKDIAHFVAHGLPSTKKKPKISFLIHPKSPDQSFKYINIDFSFLF